MSTNIRKELEKALHRPKVDGRAMYARTDGNYNANRTSNWINRAINTYNSPTNIRKIFICRGRVYIQYYASPMLNGRKDAKFKGISIELGREVEGNPMEAFRKPWALTNLEAIYFDNSFLETYDFQGYNVYSIINSTGYTKDSQVIDAIVESVGKENFPRLKSVTYIKNLKRIMEQCRLTDNWEADNKNLILSMSGSVAEKRYRVEGSITVREDTYIFDKTILKGYLSFKSEESAKRVKKERLRVTSEDSFKVSELEKTADSLSILKGKQLVRMEMITMTSEEKETTYKSFTSKGKLKYFNREGGE